VTDTRHLRIVEQSPWNKASAYHPEVIQSIRDRLNGKPRHIVIGPRPGWLASLVADWRDIISEVRGSPYSHALVALLTVVAWTAALVIPTLVGRGL
jgi:hypothetical protein